MHDRASGERANSGASAVLVAFGDYDARRLKQLASIHGGALVEKWQLFGVGSVRQRNEFATFDDFHEYVRCLQHRPPKDTGEVVPDDELKEACEYLSLRLDMLRNDIADLKYFDVVRAVSKVSLRKYVGSDLRRMILDLRAAWRATEDRAGIGPNDDQ